MDKLKRASDLLIKAEDLLRDEWCKKAKTREDVDKQQALTLLREQLREVRIDLQAKGWIRIVARDNRITTQAQNTEDKNG